MSDAIPIISSDENKLFLASPNTIKRGTPMRPEDLGPIGDFFKDLEIPRFVQFRMPGDTLEELKSLKEAGSPPIIFFTLVKMMLP